MVISRQEIRQLLLEVDLLDSGVLEDSTMVPFDSLSLLTFLQLLEDRFQVRVSDSVVSLLGDASVVEIEALLASEEELRHES